MKMVLGIVVGKNGTAPNLSDVIKAGIKAKRSEETFNRKIGPNFRPMDDWDQVYIDQIKDMDKR
jgi:hypothetical protein